MTFAWFRKHEKLFLWFAVVFTVAVFALFSAMSDLQRVLEGDESGGPGALAGTFKVATTDETIELSQVEFGVAYRNYARLMKMFSRSTEEVASDDVWAHVMTVADAHGAGLMVSDAELVRAFTGGQPLDRRSYEAIVLGSQFPSLRAFESVFRDFLLAQRWTSTKLQAAEFIPADEVFQRWRIDNELFDLDAVVFPDRDPESIPDPGSDVLRTWFDELPEFRRDSLFSVPAQYDVAFAYVPLDMQADELITSLDTAIAEQLPMPTEIELQQRFARVKASRYPGLDAPDEDAKLALSNELRLLSLAGLAHAAFRTLEAHDTEGFRTAMESHGLAVVDPEGLLDPEGLKALEPIGDDLLPLRMGSMRQVGDSQSIPSVTGAEQVAAVILLQNLVAAQPQSFAEAGTKVLAEWRKTRVDQAAKDFRKALKAAAQILPAVVEAIAPLQLAANEAADLAIAEALAATDAGPGAEAVTDELKIQLRQAELDAIQPEIDLRINEFEHELWDGAVAGLGDTAQRLSLDGVARNFRQKLTPEERDPSSLDQFIQSNPGVFQLDVGGITDVLRFTPGTTSVVVRVAGRHFPELSAMFADQEGMLAARRNQSYEKLLRARADLEPAAVMRAHDLLVPEVKQAVSSDAESQAEAAEQAAQAEELEQDL